MPDSNKLLKTSNGLHYIGEHGRTYPCTPAAGEVGSLRQMLGAVTTYHDDPLKHRNKHAAWHRALTANLPHTFREAFSQAAAEAIHWTAPRSIATDDAGIESAILHGTNTEAEHRAFGREAAMVHACDAVAEGADVREWAARAAEWRDRNDDAPPPEPRWPSSINFVVRPATEVRQ